MQKLAIALAALAAMGFSATAFADDATPQAPTAMSDSDMDKVTAGNMGGVPAAPAADNPDWGQLTARPGGCKHVGCQFGNSAGHRNNP